MTIFQLECFLTVANHLNFGRAAADLHISQPAVSHQIQSLENTLGVKLFNRTTHLVELTLEGLAFLDDARNIVSLSQKAIHRFVSTDTQELKPLAIGCTGLTQMDMMSEILRLLVSKYPYAHPSIQLLPRNRLFPMIEEGAIDIALEIKDMKSKRKTLVYQELTKTPIACVFPPEHPLSNMKTLRLNDIKPYKLILYNPAIADPETAIIQRQLSEARPPSDLYFCGHVEEALALVNSGLGVSVLPRILFPDIYNLSASIIEDTTDLSFGLYYQSKLGNPLLKEFIHLFVQRNKSTTVD